MKHAWQFVLDSLDYPVDYPFICQINRLVGGDNLVYHAGFIRNVPMTIGGTSWKPEMPIEEYRTWQIYDMLRDGKSFNMEECESELNSIR